MKSIWTILVGACAVVGVGTIVFFFSGHRGKVAKENIENKIDNLLGKNKVERQKLADQIEKTQEAVEVLFNERVETQVALERLTKQCKPLQTNYDAAVKTGTAQLAELQKVKADPTYTVSLGSVSYTQKNLADLQAVVATQTKTANALKDQLDSKKSELELAQKRFNLAVSTEKDAREKVAMFEARQKALADKQKALEAQQEAAKLLSGGKKSIANNFDEIEKTLSDLEDKTEVDFRKAEERAAVQAAKAPLPAGKGVEDVEETIRKAQEAFGPR